MALDFQLSCDFDVSEEQYWIGFVVFEQRRQENGQVRPHVTGLEIAAMELMVGQQAKFQPFSFPEELRQRFRFDTRVRTRFLCRIKNLDEAFLPYQFAQEVYFFIGSKTGQPLSNLLAPLEVTLFADANKILDTFRVSAANWGVRALAWRIAQRNGAHLELALGKTLQPDSPEQEDMAAFFARQRPYATYAETTRPTDNHTSQARSTFYAETDGAANRAGAAAMDMPNTKIHEPTPHTSGLPRKMQLGLFTIILFTLTGFLILLLAKKQITPQPNPIEFSASAITTPIPLPDIPQNFCMKYWSNLRGDSEISVPMGVERKINSIIKFVRHQNNSDIGHRSEIKELRASMAQLAHTEVNRECLESINNNPDHLQIIDNFDDFAVNRNFSMENYLKRYNILFANNIGDVDTALHSSYLKWLSGAHQLARETILIGLAAKPTDPHLWLMHGISMRSMADDEDDDGGAIYAICLGYKLLADNPNQNRLHHLGNFVKQAAKHNEKKSIRIKKLLTDDVAAVCGQYGDFSKTVFYK